MEDLFSYDFWKLVESRMREGQRKGQAIVNTAYYFYTDETRKLDGTLWDCFYDDRRIPEFLTRLLDLLTR
jgi:hypothetical protein